MARLVGNTRFDFMRWRLPAAIVSSLLVGVCALSLFVRGLDYGVDFTGGTLVELHFPTGTNLDEIRDRLNAGGLGETSVQHLGTTHDVLFRLAAAPAPSAGDAARASDVLVGVLQEDGAPVEVRRVEFVGPQIGRELAEQGALAVLYALAGILVYVAARFQWRFAVASIIALAHDIVITVGCFSLLGLKFDLSVLAAILAVTGYSLNDTIVVFDRVREEFRRLRGASTETVMNVAINATLSRTVMTGMTTLMVLLALIFAGGPSLFGFSLALIVGVVVGTWSSVYIASAAALWLGTSRADLVKPAATDEEVGANPKTIRRDP